MADDPTKKVDPVEDPKEPELGQENDDPQVDDEVKKREEHLANLDVAIETANEELRTIREAKKKAAEDPADDVEEPVDDPDKKGPAKKDPKIDFNDPAAKEWDKHLDKKVAPVRRELDQEKEEVFQFTLREFLDENPSVARDPKKVKALVGTYEQLKRNSGRTREGILLDLRRAYGAEFLDEAVGARKQDRVTDARRRALDSDAAISRGSSAYRNERESDDAYSSEDRAILARWGLTPESHQKMKREMDKKGTK